jgi:hypothetical protein
MAFCTNCGEQVESGKFCPKCGVAVGQPVGPPPPGYVPPPPPAGYGAYPVPPPGKKFPVWGIVAIIAAVLVVVAGTVVAIAVPVFLGARTNAQRRTCQSNLRTIDGAIQAYYAENGKYPPAGEVGDILVPDFIRSTPTCPTSGKPYTINRGNPPTTACPTHVPGHTL